MTTHKTSDLTPSAGMPEPSEDPRVLIYSQRNFSKIQPFRCAHFEFEDVVAEVDTADFLTPSFDPSSRRNKIARQLAYHTPLSLNPGVRSAPIRKNYDLFLAVCGDPIDLLRLNALGDWRARCKTAVLVIDELWVTLMDSYTRFLRMMDKFDAVMLYYNDSVEPLNKRIGRKVFYLPPAVDAIRFSPYPNPQERVIDVYSIGRRSAVTHRTLLDMAAQQSTFYVYDTTTADQVLNPMEHRQLYANSLKRSRYFIVNPALIDRPDIRGDQIEIGYRYFDSAASGAIMIGERPNNAVFQGLFDWPDSLVDLAYNSTDIDKVIRALDEQPEKQEAMRRMSVRQALLRHDWAYRWEFILKTVGHEALPRIMKRKARLHDLANLAMPDSSIHVNGRRESGLRLASS